MRVQQGHPLAPRQFQVEFSGTSVFDQVIYLELNEGAPAHFRCCENRFVAGFQKLTNDMYRMIVNASSSFGLLF
jgi:hypothetical protein